MRIIKEGDPVRAASIRRFECPVCGCVWEANRTEYIRLPESATFYVKSGLRVEQFSFRCNCPTCDYEVVLKENVTGEGSAEDGAD